MGKCSANFLKISHIPIVIMIIKIAVFWIMGDVAHDWKIYKTFTVAGSFK